MQMHIYSCHTFIVLYVSFTCQKWTQKEKKQKLSWSYNINEFLDTIKNNEKYELVTNFRI